MKARATTGVLAALAWAMGCRAQLIGPIPPATAPTPPYTTPAKTEPPLVEAAVTEPAAPSIVARDAQGRLKPISGTAEEAAVAAYAFDAARREKIAASSAARKLDLDRFVITNLDKALAAEKLKPTIEKSSDFNELFQARDLNIALRHERLIDRLERDRAITMAQRVRLDETLLNYDRARKEEIEKDAGGDPTRTGVLNLRQTFADAMREPLESLGRQVRDVCEHLTEVKDVVKLRPEQEAALAGAQAEADSGRAAALRERFVRETLDVEQQRAAMTARVGTRAGVK